MGVEHQKRERTPLGLVVEIRIKYIEHQGVVHHLYSFVNIKWHSLYDSLFLSLSSLFCVTFYGL